MDDQTLLEVFKLLGFEDKQTQIYGCLLQYPRIGLRDIARITKIPRTSLYDYYPKLLAKGYIIESSDQGKRIFSANNPKILLDELNKLKRGVNKCQKEYQLLLNKYQQSHQSSDLFPKISYYSDESGLRRVFNLILTYKETRVLYLGNKDNDVAWFSKDLNKWFLEEELKRGIKSKQLFYNDELTKWFLKNYEHKIGEVKVINSDFYNDEGDIDKYIFGDYIALIDYTRQIAVLIKDHEFAHNEVIQFDMLWDKN